MTTTHAATAGTSDTPLEGSGADRPTNSVNDVVDAGRLTPLAHTRIVTATLDNAFAILAELHPLDVLTGLLPRPTRFDILAALTRVDAIDTYTKTLVMDVLSVMYPIARTLTNLSPEYRSSVRREAERVLADDTEPDAAVRRLRLGNTDPRFQVDGFDTGLAVAAAIFADGGSTLYGNGHPFYHSLRAQTAQQAKDKDDSSGVAKADFLGAIGGAVGGATAGGAGALPGAVGGACLGSATQILGNMWDDIFGDDGVPDGDVGDFPIPDGGAGPGGDGGVPA